MTAECWRVVVDPRAKRQIDSLGHVAADRIYQFINKRIAQTADPRAAGKALTGQFAGLWRYRVGDHRIICAIRDAELVVLVLEAGHRKHIYR